MTKASTDTRTVSTTRLNPTGNPGRLSVSPAVRVYLGHFAAVIMLFIFVATMLSLAAVPLTYAALVYLILWGAIIVGTGELSLLVCDIDNVVARPLVATALGVVITAVSLVPGTVLLGQSAGAVLACWAGITAIAAVALRRRFSLPEPSEWPDLWIMLATAIVVGLWCRGVARAAPALDASGILNAWIDYYIHGEETAQFGDPKAVGRGAILLADYPHRFYHYGMYVLPAALMGVVKASGLAVATSVVLPVGLFVGALGAYALAAELGGRVAGAIALAALTLLPDASHYGLANGLFGFHWSMFTSPGAGYGLAASALALIMVSRWIRSGRLAPLLLAAASTAALTQLRVHFFIWLAPALIATMTLHTRWARHHARSLALWAGAFLVLGLGLAAVPAVTHLWLKHSAVAAYLNFVHTGNEPTGYTGFYQSLLEHLPSTLVLFLGTLLVVPAILGLFVLAYPLALAAAVRRTGWNSLDWFPLTVFVMMAVVTLLAPPAPWGSVTEYQHRPFVLMYAVVVIWTAANVSRALPASSAATVWTGLASLVLVAGVLFASRVADPASPRQAWAQDHYRRPIGGGVLAAAHHLQSAAQPGDTVAVGPIDPAADIIDRALEVTSLSNVPSYIARAGRQLVQDKSRAAVARERLAFLQRLQINPDLGSVSDALRGRGVTWYVWLGPTGPAFDPDRRRATVTDGDSAVYRIARAGRQANAEAR